MISNTTSQEDDSDIIEAGYKPQLRRKMNFFASFAVSFSFMSVLMGVFSNYSYVLTKAGPFGFWTWIIVGAGQMLVAIVFAEMAGRVPLTGALYNWNNTLSHPWIAVTVHWLTVFAYAIGGAGIIVASMGPLQSFLGRNLDTNTIRWIGLSTFFVQFLINVLEIRLAAYLTKLAVAAEIIAIVGFGLVILLIILFKGQADFSLLTNIPSSPIPYFPAFLSCTLLGAWTIFGFETPSDLSEETINPKIVTPKSIIMSVVASILLGSFLLFVLTIAIPNLNTITNSADPISAIISSRLGNIATEVFLFFVLLAMFATSLLSITLASRLLFAVSRDKHFFGHAKFSKISAYGIPFYSVFLVSLVEVVIFLTMYGLSALYASGVVLLFSAYLITVVNFAFGINKLPTTKNFSLGKWHWPITILAAIWLVAQIAILTIPQEFHIAAIIGFGIIIFSSLQYLLQKLTSKHT